MNLKTFSRFGAFGSVGCVGYIFGVFIERNKNSKCKIFKYPGLPIFGTVSAATSFVPSNTEPVSPQEVITTNKSRVGQVS